MNDWIFLRRVKVRDLNKYQVRFWSDRRIYEQFQAICEKEDVLLQDAFTDFMKWFVKRYEDDKLKIK